MRLVPKLSMFLVGAAALVLSARTVMRIEIDAARFDDDMKHDHAIAAHVLATSMGSTLRRDGEARASELVVAAKRPGDAVAFLWTRGAGVGALSPEERVTLRGGGVVQRFVRGASNAELVSFVAVLADDEGAGVLELRESLAERDAYVRADVRDAVALLVALLVLLSAITVALSRWLVGRPVQTLVAKARSVAKGSLGPPVVLDGPDELAFLAVEMNAMCTAIEVARARAASENEAKLRAQAELRHAERLATVGMLAAGIAHELGTPLSVVGGHAQMIASRETEGDGAVASARVIEQQVARVTRVIRQLLDYARRRGADGPDGASADLALTAASVVGLLEPLARSRGVQVSCEGEHVEAAIDPASFEQIVTNLVVNAIHATPSGGRARVSIAGRETDTETARVAVLEVEDDGCGMPPDVVARACEPFFTTKRPGEGTGLGLSVVQGIVEDHGGTMRIESAVGRGTRVEVRLPIIERTVSTEAVEDTPTARPTPS